MDNIEDYIQALKETCEQKQDFTDTIEYNDTRLRVSCNGSGVYTLIEYTYIIKSEMSSISYEQLKQVLANNKDKFKRMSSDKVQEFRSKKIIIKRERIITELGI